MSDRIKSIKSGDHILAIYQDEERKFVEAFQFLKEGLENGEAVMIITDRFSHDEILKRMEKEWEIDVKEFERNGFIEIRTTDQWYIHHGFPDSEKFAPFWFAMAELAHMRGRNGLRAFGDTTSFFERGYSNECIAYEATLSKKFEHGLTGLCAYQSKDIEGLSRQQFDALCQHHNVVWV